MTTLTWQPTAPLHHLEARAMLYAQIRAFFAKRGVLEVETPLLCLRGGTDPYIQPITGHYKGPGAPEGRDYFLQTSPEFAMKRLLAAGIGSIYQISKTFRNGEFGRYHNPEFTMLEWYRLDFDHHRLMDEMDDLLKAVLACKTASRISYRDLFCEFVALDPLQATTQSLQAACLHHGIVLSDHEGLSQDDYLGLLMSHVIEPQIGFDAPCFIYDFPASQCALAKIRADDPPVSERFEVYIQGIELANGFHELADFREQKQRFDAQRAFRQSQGLPDVVQDERLIAALEAGLPHSAGVAMGLDRLLMIKLKSDSIRDVLAFPFDIA